MTPRPILCEIETPLTPESLTERLRGQADLVLLRSYPRQSGTELGGHCDSADARYSFVVSRPFLTFRSRGSRCEITQHATRDTQHVSHSTQHVQFGNPWHILDSLMSKFEMLDEIDLPFPLGGCFGYWGYDLKNFVEPKLSRRAVNDLELPDCHVGFYGSLVAFDHRLGKTWIIATGLAADGSRSQQRAEAELEFWRALLKTEPERSADFQAGPHPISRNRADSEISAPILAESNVSRTEFLAAVERARSYIRAGDIYQVNLSHRLTTPCELSGWELFETLGDVSPAPFAAYLDCGEFELASSSPEQFLRLSGSHIQTRPIKGTRPRSADSIRDAQLTYELQTSAKEMAELVMITDLLRNDLGKVCDFGSVNVPDLARLEKFAHVQHLVSTVEGRLRTGMTHFGAFSSCFPGGSITGAPKIRAMEIIDELEPVSRGPYTGTLGYIGFNRESQLSIVIRTAIRKDRLAHFNVGAGIVADSNPEAEYEETLAKARGFEAALWRRRFACANQSVR